MTGGVSDRAGVATEAEGAVVWLATSKQRRSAGFDALLAANINHHMQRGKNKTKQNNPDKPHPQSNIVAVFCWASR